MIEPSHPCVTMIAPRLGHSTASRRGAPALSEANDTPKTEIETFESGKIEAITGACLLKAGNQYPEFGAWAADK